MVYKPLSLTEKIKEYINEFLVIFRDSRTLKDRIVILMGYSKTPIYLLNYLRSIPNKKTLISGVTIKNNYGTFFCGRDLYSVLYFSSSFESEVRKKLYEMRGGVVIDIGANGGMHSIPLAKLNKKVIAIEPEPKNFEILKKNISLNHLKNITPLRVACSDKDGKSYLYLDDESAGGHTIVLENTARKKRKAEIETVKLDTIIKKFKIDRVSLIKVDVEGAESLVLKGAIKTIKKDHPKIVFEAWNEEHLDKVKKILEPLSYKIGKIARDNYLAI